MDEKIVSGIMLALLLIGMSALALNIQLAEAYVSTLTIYICADGSVFPPTAPIQRHEDLYTFMDDIYHEGAYAAIQVERSNITIDGKGHTLQGPGAKDGFYLRCASRAANNITIRNTNIRNFSCGIRVWKLSSHNTFTENNITDNSVGIDASDSSNCSIFSNVLARNYNGISMYDGFDNNIFGNKITDNLCGITLRSIHDGIYRNKIFGNNITNSEHWGVSISGHYNVVLGNRITDNSVGIYMGFSNNTVMGNDISNNNFGIRVQSSDFNIISGNNITGNRPYYGIEISTVIGESSENNTVCANNIIDNEYGVYLGWLASNNTVFENKIANNSHGLWAWGSLASNNKLYHNNLIQNAEQAIAGAWANSWDDGYPSGGNFWSDYIGVDLYSGPYQNETGNDGIGDIPYIIYGRRNQDNYPLMKPWTQVPHVDDTQAYIDYVNETIQDLPDEMFSRPGEDVADVKNDFSDLLNDTLENIEEGNYTRAIEKLNRIKAKIHEEMVESPERQEIISMIDNLITYLERKNKGEN